MTDANLEEAVAPFHCGRVAIVGRPNVGKSTLLNLLVKFKLSAVSPRPQTTRHKVLGILTGPGYQVVFLDTPGVPQRTGHELDRLLGSRAREAMQEADLVVLLVEPRFPGGVERRLVSELRQLDRPVFLAINKIDLVSKPELLPVMEAYARLYPFLDIVPVSALKSDGLDVLLDPLVQRLPEGPPMFSEDEVTDRPERFLTGEIIRGLVFNTYREEVPYCVAVEIDTFREASAEHGGKDHISVVLWVEKESQKGLLIGRGGERLKAVGAQARQEIEALLERPVFLELWVKAYPNWRKDAAFLQRVGY